MNNFFELCGKGEPLGPSHTDITLSAVQQLPLTSQSALSDPISYSEMGMSVSHQSVSEYPFQRLLQMLLVSVSETSDVTSDLEV